MNTDSGVKTNNLGNVQKVVVADSLAPMVDNIFSNYHILEVEYFA